MSKVTKRLFTGLLGVLLLGTVESASMAGVLYTYSYDAATLALTWAGDNQATEKDGNSATNFVLNDGNISPDNVDGWGAGNFGMIFNDASNTVPQPGLTIDLGSSLALTSLDVYYIVKAAAGVTAYESLDIEVDGNPLPQFTAFDQSADDNIGSKTRMVSIDLTGNTGQLLSLNFGNTSQWGGLTEIEVFATAIPEPSTSLLALSGLMAMMYRRRRN